MEWLVWRGVNRRGGRRRRGARAWTIVYVVFEDVVFEDVVFEDVVFEELTHRKSPVRAVDVDRDKHFVKSKNVARGGGALDFPRPAPGVTGINWRHGGMAM